MAHFTARRIDYGRGLVTAAEGKRASVGRDVEAVNGRWLFDKSCRSRFPFQVGDVERAFGIDVGKARRVTQESHRLEPSLKSATRVVQIKRSSIPDAQMSVISRRYDPLVVR